MIYINGHRSSRADLARLLEQGKRGEVTAKARTEKRGGVCVTHIFIDKINKQKSEF